MPASIPLVQFLEDIRTTAAAVGAPFSAPVTRKVLEVYAESFATGAVLWKATDRPGDSLSYRFYSNQPTDTVALALRAGLLDPAHPLIPLVRSWSALYGGVPEQSCDFDAGRGLVKTWLFLGGTRPLADVLGAEGVPDSLRRHAPSFHQLGLNHVRFTAIDYRHDTINLYFRVAGSFTPLQGARIAAVAHAPPPPPWQVAELLEFLPQGAYMVAVTVSVRTGEPKRVCFYAPKLSAGRLPSVGKQLARFFAEAPCYDEDEVNVGAWSFGGAGGTYRKGERSCFGDLGATFRRWGAFFSGDSQVDPVLLPTA
jgi:4-hydroxyphenylpyruvate 3-dimethylallyltransferase